MQTLKTKEDEAKKLPAAKDSFYMSNKALILQLAALFAVSTLAVYGTLASDKQLEKIMPEAKTFASVTNFKPSGMSAFYELCQRVFRKRHVSEWAFPYRKLNGSTRTSAVNPAHGVLIIVSPDESLAEFEVENILDWVRQGNALVYLDNFQFRHTKRMLDKIGVTARDIDEELTDQVTDGRTDLPEYTHLRVLNVSTQQKLSGGTALATLGDKTIIVEQKLGKGRILIGSCPQMVCNKQITKTDHWSNFQFLHNWIATTSGDILFDEKCHGSTRGLNVVFYFLHGPTGYVGLQLGLILLIAILSGHQRFGATLIVRNLRRISNLEHIEGLSNTYQRAHARQAVLAIIWHSVRLKLCKVLQISPREQDEKLNQALRAQAQSHGGGAGILEKVERCEAAVNRKDLSDEDLKELVAACDKISEQAESLLTTGKAEQKGI
ncbi:MAG: DUF4350 domain-containing protein [Cyanobacteria bacterium SZAS TMP-1]|nr:DUF4350 domain-containing protein [Cyanobacteria bacterium SZAS TMP-1]